ncbi:ceramide synthase 2-like [Pecten maximus]|uniref:ceramide synthase 2-like n=1 Tax=Pecten maximus TaxID=6579 RepID=UPI0014590132|nr:ceramide synthase 2-like [Pecten maximus]XP_033762173.1 ceramide synthase 2-like [Pecten maximus]XP_033762174.1 ceramide synthase 2-like [Pecten maximus]
MESLQTFRNWFWSESFWLPANVTWTTFENPPPGEYYPLERHLLLPSLVLGVLLLGVRLVYERCMVVPFAKFMGLRPKKHYAVEKNPTLESLYVTEKFPKQDQVEKLSKKTSLTERQIQRWFRHRRSQDIPGRMKKFRECGWHFLFYSVSFFGGLYILWDKPYFWDTKYFWFNIGRQHVPNDVYWYYMIELSFYWNLVFTLVTDHKRKDFTEMVVHHIVTILLIYFSFACNQIRIGTLVLIIHDSVDFWMAAAKMAIYLKKMKVADSLFVIFLVVWFFTRLYIYPFRIVWSTSVQSLQYATIFPVYWLLNGLLWILQVLHIIWTYMILRMVMEKLTGKDLKDVRSDTETSSGGEDKETNVNGSTASLRKLHVSENGSS